MSEGSGLGRQVDLGQDKMLSGVMIQGGKHRDKNVFMKRFRLGHSLDGEDWAVFREDNSTKPKVGVRPRGGRGGVCGWVGGLPEACLSPQTDAPHTAAPLLEGSSRNAGSQAANG